MYAYKDRFKIIRLYFKYESYVTVINESGYLSHKVL